MKIKAEMAPIAASSFEMGDNFAEGGPEERPVHRVHLPPFSIASTLVTASEFDAVYRWTCQHGYTFINRGKGKGEDHPVHSINWYDAVK